MEKLTWVFLFAVTTIELAAQGSSANFQSFNPRFEVLTLPGGVLGNSVQSMVQDRAGFLWFASQDGLHRFDGQNFRTFHYDPTDENSLSSNYCESIFLDSRGILWVTHYTGGGLTSFDPETEIFTRYHHDPKDPGSLSHETNHVVAETPDGYIWVGSEAGLDRLDRKTGKFKHFSQDPDNPNSLSYNCVRGIYVDKKGTLWVATGFSWDNDQTTGGLNRFDSKTETFTRYLNNPRDSGTLINNKVRAMLEDRQGNFWVGTNGDGLHLMNREKGRFSRLTYDPKKRSKLSRPMLRGTTATDFNLGDHVACLFEDHAGRIWICGYPGGLNVFEPTTGIIHHFEPGSKDGDLTVPNLWSIFQTKDGILWLCSGGFGGQVYRVTVQDPRFSYYDFDRTGKQIGERISAVAKDRAGNIWFGFNGSPSLARFDQKTGRIFPIAFSEKPASFGAKQVLGIWFDRLGEMWVDTERGVWHRDRHTGKFRQYLAHLTNAWRRSFSDDQEGFIWVTDWATGLYKIDPLTGQFQNFRSKTENTPPDSLNLIGRYPRSVLVDSKGQTWIGGGSWNDLKYPLFLDRLDADKKTFTHFLRKKEAGSAMNLTEDAEGNLWFVDNLNYLQKLNTLDGSRKKFAPPNIRFARAAEGMGFVGLSKSVDGRLWVFHDGSVYEFDPKTERFFAYGKMHGVRPVGSLYSNLFTAADGEMLVVGQTGLLAFHPQNIHAEPISSGPDIRITAFSLLGKTVAPGNKGKHFSGVLKKPVWKTSEIQLVHNQNVFAFSVACFDFHGADIQLEFILENYDRFGWRRDLHDGETPTYINVPPGKYTFRVRGSDSHGVWNKQGARINITILPPWWKTWWAYTTYGLCLVIGILYFDRFQRKRIAERERAKTRERELVQAKEIEKAYTNLRATQAQLIQSEKLASLGELTAGIAHEIQNPLNFVNNFAEVSAEMLDEMHEELEKGDTTEAIAIATDLKTNLEKINHHGQRASSIVKGMLEHSRASTGVKAPTDLNALADEYLRLAYHGLRAKDSNFNATIETHFDPDLPKIEVIPQDIGRVILNLINNAFYAVTEKAKQGIEGYQPTVIVSTRLRLRSATESTIEISVQDNGPGIPESIRDKIFQPFFTTKPTGQGTGLGLSLAYDIVTKGHGGTLMVESIAGEGTAFILTLTQNPSQP